MTNLKRRLVVLECARSLAVKTPLRVIVGACFGAPDLATSKCMTRSPNGQLIEYVHLEGCADDISEKELEKWIASFPIDTSSERRVGKGTARPINE